LAQEFIGELLEEHLILSGCFFPVRTMFVWEGQMTIDDEFKVILKAREGNYPNIEDYIKEKHPYRAPEIIKLSAEFGSAEFKKFLVSQKRLE